MFKKNIIYAVGLHQGGGKVILESFLSKFHNRERIELIVDDRLSNKLLNDNQYDKNFSIKVVSSKFFARIIHEYNLKKYPNNTNILFLNGLPPLFKLKSRTLVFFQNANILSIPSQTNFFEWLFSFDFLRYVKFILCKNHVNEWYVYSESSRNYIKKYIKLPISIKKIDSDFIDRKIIERKNLKNLKVNYDLFYPASGEKHKNHNNLIKSLIILSNNNFFPSLLLTLKSNEYKKLNIDYFIDKYKLNITNKFFESKEELYNAFNSSRAVIYPSFHETLGIPLLEASQFGIDIISSESDYVRDNVNPTDVFDPKSPISISRSIMRYFKYKIESDNLINHDIIIEYLLNKN